MTIAVHDQNLAVLVGLFADLATIPVDPFKPATPAIGARFYARDTGQSFELRPGLTFTDPRVWVEIGETTGGDLIVEGNLTVNGNTQLGNAPTDTTETSGDLTVDGTLRVRGNTQLGDDAGDTLATSGAATIAGDLMVNGNTQLGDAPGDTVMTSGNVGVGGTLSTVGDVTVGGDLILPGTGSHFLAKEWMGIALTAGPTAMSRFAAGGGYTILVPDKPGSILTTSVDLDAPLALGDTLTVQWSKNGTPIVGTDVTATAGQDRAVAFYSQGTFTFLGGDKLEIIMTVVSATGANVNAGGIITQ